MAAKRLHSDEVSIDVELVRNLLAEQFPNWAYLPVTAVRSTGTVNAIYRLGDDKYVRLPRLKDWADCLQKELLWLPKVAPQISLAIPEPLAAGLPGSGYPFAWAVYRWIAGRTLDGRSRCSDLQVAEILAGFIKQVRQVNLAGAPRSSRDRPLRLRDTEARQAIAAARGMLDADAATSAWELALQAPEWDKRPFWTHGDLLPPNLLWEQGRLKAVIDFGNMGIGDPAVDVIPAWTMFGEAAREHFRQVLEVDKATWARSRGFALHQALLIIPYYHKTNPQFAAMAIRTVKEIQGDLGQFSSVMQTHPEF